MRQRRSELGVHPRQKRPREPTQYRLTAAGLLENAKQTLHGEGLDGSEVPQADIQPLTHG